MRRSILFSLIAALLLVAGQTLVAAQVTGANLLANPGFEEGTIYWTVDPGSAEGSLTLPAHTGAWSLQLTKRTRSGAARVFQEVAVEPGATYAMSGWLRWDDATVTTAQLRVTWFDAAGAPTGSRVEIAAAAMSPEFQFLSADSLVAPTGAALARVEGYISLSVPNPVTAPLFDDFALVLVAPAPSPAPTATPEPAPATPAPTMTATTEASDATPTPEVSETPTVESPLTATPTEEPSPATPSTTPTATGTPGPSATPTPLPPVLINEYLPRPASDWNGDGIADSGDQYIELFNAGNEVVALEGWSLEAQAHGDAPYRFPAGAAIGPAEHLLIFASVTGITLGAGSDDLHLVAPDGQPADSHTYLLAKVDSSWQRAGDGATTWVDAWPPSPGTSNMAPTPTAGPTDTATPLPAATSTETGTPTAGPTSTATPTGTNTPTLTPVSSATVTRSPSPTVAPSATRETTPTPFPVILLTELLPAPSLVDWDEDGNADFRDEWVELFNPGAEEADLTGWQVDDEAFGGSRPYSIPDGTRLAPGAFLLFFRAETGVIFNNDGDTVRLIRPDGLLADSFDYRAAGADASYSRDVEGQWHSGWPPSPGRASMAPTPTPSPSATASPTPTRTATPTALPTASNTPTTTRTATPTRLPTGTPSATPTRSPSSTVDPGAPVRLNEFLAAPRTVDWNGDGVIDTGDEWIELWNWGDGDLSLAGWSLDDGEGGTRPYIFPDGAEISPGEHLLLFHTVTGVGLNNDGDTLRLLRPDGEPHDQFTYQIAVADLTFARDAGGWHSGWAPSPGAANPAATPTPSASPTATASPSPSATPTLVPTAPPSSTATPDLHATATPTVTMTPTPVVSVRLNEVLAAPGAVDWNGDGVVGAGDEWVELFNAGPDTADLTGWQIDDRAEQGSRPYTFLPGTHLPPGELLLLFGRDTAIRLNNDGDDVRLLRPDGSTADIFVYRRAGQDQSYSRGEDLQWHGDWLPSPGRINQPPPTPTATPSLTSSPTPAAPSATPTMSPTATPTSTQTTTPTSTPSPTRTMTASPTASEIPTATAVPTTAPSPTPAPTASPTAIPDSNIRINEILPAPATVDWDGDGIANADDEWVELFNPGPGPADLNGWVLDDRGNGGQRPYRLPRGFVVPPGEFVVLYHRTTGVGLNNDGDDVRLLRPDGVLHDAFSYWRTRPDQTYARDESGAWQQGWPPSPGAANRAPTPTVTPTATATPSATATPTRSPSPTASPTSTPSPLPTASATPTASASATASPSPSPTASRTATSSPTATILPDLPLRLNELLPAPRTVDWDGDGTAGARDEWVELYNGGTTIITLEGWALDDRDGGGSRPYLLPPGARIGPRQFLVLYRRDTGIVLNNDGDTLRLLRPDGSPHDAFDYTRARTDAAFARDDHGAWHEQWAPSPGLTNRPPTPTATATSTPSPSSTSNATPTATPSGTATATPTASRTATATPTGTPTPTTTVSPNAPIRLNEVLPAPRATDWDGDGTADARDEWIEVANRGREPLTLAGWQLDDQEEGSRPYAFPAGAELRPGEVLVLFRRETGVILNNAGDEVRLLRPDGVLHDAFAFTRAGSDSAFARDTVGRWHAGWPPSPGQANVAPSPTATPTATPTALPTATQSPTATPTSSATSTPSPSATATIGPDAAIHLNELLPAPASQDWDGDGVANASDEWVELANLGTEPVELGSWQLDDRVGEGSRPYSFPPETRLEPGGFLLLFRRDTRITLNNDGDELHLLRPDGSLHDSVTFGRTPPDAAISRDASGAWHPGWPPSPGGPNQPAVLTPTATAGPIVPLLISEIVYDGTERGDGDEFVEVFNPTGESVNLEGWGIGDEIHRGGREGLYRFPAYQLAPGAAVVVARDGSAFQARYGYAPEFEVEPGDLDLPGAANMQRDTVWGKGHWALSDSGDELILIDQYDRTVDALAFRNGDFAALGLLGHDISAPAPRSLSRVGDWRSTNLNDIVVYQSPSPGQVVRPPAPPPAPPAAVFGDGLYAFFGSLHAHSTYSDGSGPPPYAFAVARANGLHFMALTDHSNWFSAAEWHALGAAADAATVPGAFVALRGFEWTHRTNGHVNVFNSADYISRDEAAGDELADLYTFLAARPAAIGEFNHPFPGHFDDLRLLPALRSQMALIEVGNSRPDYARRYVEYYWRALQNGWRVGAAANLDTESADWGRDGGLRTGILAPSLDPAGLLDAIRARRTFATEDSNLAIALKAGRAWMGSEIPAGTVTLEIIASDGNGEAATLELWRDGGAVARTELGLSAVPQRWAITVEARPGEALVAYASQADGERAWSSPLFVVGGWRPPPLQITEVLPAPRDVDFNGDGVLDSNDEFIELHNPMDEPVPVTGWQVDDQEGGSRPYTLPFGTVIPARGYLVLFKSQSGVALDQVGDHARLIAPNGAVVDDVTWDRFPGYDRSVSRRADGGWELWAEPSPGGPMREDEDDGEEGSGGAGPPVDAGAAAPYTRTLSSQPPAVVTIAEARILPARRRVAVRGQVTTPAGLMGERTFYIQDATAGLRVYFRRDVLPPMEVGDWVTVAGWMGSYRGAPELHPFDAASIVVEGSGEEPLPRLVATGQIPPAEGQLVVVEGAVAGWERFSWTLDDGSGPAEIVLRRASGLRRPWLERGERRRVAGIVVRDDQRFSVVPRFAADLDAGAGAAAPRFMATTGGSAP